MLFTANAAGSWPVPAATHPALAPKLGVSVGVPVAFKGPRVGLQAEAVGLDSFATLSAPSRRPCPVSSAASFAVEGVVHHSGVPGPRAGSNPPAPARPGPDPGPSRSGPSGPPRACGRPGAWRSRRPVHSRRAGPANARHPRRRPPRQSRHGQASGPRPQAAGLWPVHGDGSGSWQTSHAITR